MKLDKVGNLKLENIDYEHIQGRIDEEDMTVQEAVEAELSTHGINIKDVYSIETDLGQMQEHLNLYAKITCEIKTGRK